jgi:ribonuclease T2
MPISVSKRLGAVCLSLALVASSAGPCLAHGKSRHASAPRSFSYYVLALTWTPGFCATHSDPAECDHGYAFGLHGLWPQRSANQWDENCAGPKLTPDEREKYKTLYASPSLIDHEWPKHGTCSGLAPSAYFDLSDQLKHKVVIPQAYMSAHTVGAQEIPALKQAFLQANPGLPADGISATTDQRVLAEVRICFSKTGEFRSCQ